VTSQLSWSIIAIDDPRWEDSLALAPHDVYNTAEFVRLEASRLGARPVAFVATDGECVFHVALLLRAIPFADGSVLDAVSPYGYPGIVLNAAARLNPSFVNDSLNALVGALRDAGVCSAFVRLHPATE
jgi:hypothetical protein